MVQHVLTFPSEWAMYLLTIHILSSQKFHPIYSTYYTTDLNEHLLVEGAPLKGMYGSILMNGNVGQKTNKQKHC